MVRNLTGGAGGVFLAAALAASLGLLLAGTEAGVQVRGSGASSRVEVFTRRGLVSLPWSLPALTAASLASLTGVEVSCGGGGDWGAWT